MNKSINKYLSCLFCTLSFLSAYLFYFFSAGFCLLSTTFAVAEEKKSNMLLALPPILAANISPPIKQPPGNISSLRIYVAGESVEELNHFNNLPFHEDGALNDRGAENNTLYEYGWMVPFSESLQRLAPDLSIQWKGSGCWVDHDTYECSEGTHTNSNIGNTSAVSGSTIASWLSDKGAELTGKEFCYDVAFASRGGNDLGNDIVKSTYKNQLRQLIMMLDQGSNCRTHPIIYVTAHLLDVGGWNYGVQQADIDDWMITQKAYYVTVAQELVNELNNQNGMRIRFIDLWTPFREDSTTIAFPSETWWTVDSGTGVRMPNLSKIHRDEQHPRRLASIFAGENAANQINITELRQLLNP